MTVFVYQSFELIREENNGLSDWEGAQFSQFSRVALQGQEHRVRQCCRSVAPFGRVLLLRECDWTRCRTPELRWKYPEKITNMSDNWLHRWLWFRGDPPWRRWCCCGWAIGGRRTRDARGGSACSDPSCSHTLKCSWRCRGEWTRTAAPNTTTSQAKQFGRFSLYLACRLVNKWLTVVSLLTTSIEWTDISIFTRTER